jgi:hypothetical protein
MKRLKLTLFALAVVATPFMPAIVAASERKTEWWWWVILFIKEAGGSWNLW